MPNTISKTKIQFTIFNDFISLFLINVIENIFIFNLIVRLKIFMIDVSVIDINYNYELVYQKVQLNDSF